VKISLTQKTAAALAVTALVLLVGVLSFATVSELIRAVTRVDRTAEVIIRLEAVLSDLKDAETGQRGYLLTGDSAYLAPYHEAHEQVGEEIAVLRALGARQEVRLRRLDTLSNYAAAKFSELDATLALRDRAGLDRAAVAVRTDRGKQIMDSARALVARMEESERRQRADEMAARADVARQSLWVIAAGTLVAFLLSLLMNRAIRADVLEQLRIRDQLERQSATLATQARELADQVEASKALADRLEQTNAQLHDVIAEAERARAAADAANRAKSDFLATMSHEIRTPINAVIGYTELLELGLSGPLTDDQRSQLARIRASTQHLLGLVNEVLDLAKIESGTLQVEAAQANVGTTVEAALALIRPQATAKGIALSERCEGVREAAYLGDEHRVRQVVINLLGNALKFTDPGGRIEVRCEVLAHAPNDIPSPLRGPYVAIRVSDTGIGIAHDQLAAIFEPFTQAAGPHTSYYARNRGGTGLGLAISRRLARLMRGEITVTSTLGQGSTFTLWLPASPREAFAPATARRTERPGAPSTASRSP
jgi:signal transduction histidine kinase